MILAVGAVELFYEKQGKGRPLILLHGNGEDHHIFDESVDALAKEWTVYRPDSRGHGQSSPVREFHYQDMAEDIMIAFWKHIHILLRRHLLLRYNVWSRFHGIRMISDRNTCLRNKR